MASTTQSTSGGSRAAFRHACPKCGSSDVRRLALIHEAGLPLESPAEGARRSRSALADQAAPPSQRNVLSWGVLAGAGLVVALASLVHVGWGTVLAGAVTLLSAALAVRASRYNSAVYPGLHDLWARSYMCGRCGEVFAE
jgi:predicted RNA-binding Zn-ribbon protein involved in translation (DUF1610 family)